MQENEYKGAYNSINERRCVFEKAVLSRCCSCVKAQRFNLADREGVACQSQSALVLCQTLLEQLRQNARFALHEVHLIGPLPHAKEIKVQNGGLLGLQRIALPDLALELKVENIHGLISIAINNFTNLDNLPYDQIVQSIAGYEIRPKRSRR